MYCDVAVCISCRCLTVDLAVQFTSVVSETWVLSVLRHAAKDGKLGEFNVNASSIIGIPPVIKSTPTQPMGKTTPRLSGGTLPCSRVYQISFVFLLIV